ncbi:MAG: hypothetical protein WBA61_07265 [Aequorivita sp.]
MKIKIQLLLALLFLALIGCDNNNEATDRLLIKVDSLQVQNDSLMEILNKGKIEPEASEPPQWYYPETDSRKLLELGIGDPEAYIENALRERIDLIPMDAVLGGTMRYSNIQLLGGKWLIADFEDGHVYGRAIFEYTIKDNDKLHFKIIAFSEN